MYVEWPGIAKSAQLERDVRDDLQKARIKTAIGSLTYV